MLYSTGMNVCHVVDKYTLSIGQSSVCSILTGLLNW